MWISNKLNGLKALWQFENRWQLLLSRLLFRSNGLNIYRLNGMEILIDHSVSDESGTRKVLTSTMYQQYFPAMNFTQPINVLDLGGNGGGFGLMLKQHNLKIKKIVAVEFNPLTYLRMHFNMKRNIDAEVICLNAAVCGEEKKLRLKVGKGGTSDSIYNPIESSEGKEIEITGVTFDSLYKTYFENEQIDLCKIDIEGAEHEIFAFPHHTALSQTRFLIMEIHGNDEKQNQHILQKLASLGFERVRITQAETDEEVYCFKNQNLVKPSSTVAETASRDDRLHRP